MGDGDRPRVLCVDDERHVLDGLRRQLRSRFEVATAEGASAGLELLDREGPFAVVLSDMRMPGMDGATFLRLVRERSPDTVRVLLTGHADIDTAIAAVNEGNIFRFLTKPCPSEVLLPALAAAAEQYQRVIAEREDAEVSRALSEVAEALGSCAGEERIWRELVERLPRLLGVEWALGFRWEEGDGRLSLAAGAGVPQAVRLASGRLRLDEVPELGGRLSSPAVRMEEGPGSFIGRFSEGSLTGFHLSVGVVRGTAALGWLACGYVHQKTPMTSRQLRLARGVARHAAVAIESARLAARVVEAERFGSEFLARISHELRTPLHVIMGYAEMLQEGVSGVLSPEQRAMVARIEQSGQELFECVEAILSARDLQRGQATARMEPIPMRELLRLLEASTAGLPRSPAVTFDWEVTADDRGTMLTDRAKLALIVRSLVGNAFKFTAEGHVAVRIKPEGGMLAIEVVDTGIGIAERDLPRVFDMFRQLDGSSARRQGGLGLGLYLVDRFVEQLGGTVEVRSWLGRGSSFRVVLPGYASATQAGVEEP